MSTTLGSIFMIDQVVEIQAKCNVHLNKSYSPRLISKERWKNIHIYIVMFVLMKISMQYVSFQYFQFVVSCIPPVSQNNSVVSSRRARFRSSSRARLLSCRDWSVVTVRGQPNFLPHLWRTLCHSESLPLPEVSKILHFGMAKF